RNDAFTRHSRLRRRYRAGRGCRLKSSRIIRRPACWFCLAHPERFAYVRPGNVLESPIVSWSRALAAVALPFCVRQSSAYHGNEASQTKPRACAATGALGGGHGVSVW